MGKDARLPLVLIGGRSNIKIDWERLAPSLSRNRPGTSLFIVNSLGFFETLLVLVYDHRLHEFCGVSR